MKVIDFKSNKNMFNNEHIRFKSGHSLTQLRTGFQSKMKSITFKTLTK